MSFLKKSLEKRIQELRKSIEAQATELAAYEQVLALESGKPLPTLNPAPVTVAAAVKLQTHPAAPAKKKATPSRPAVAPGAPISVEFNGSRTDFVAAVLKERGSAGVTPPEIAKAFASRRISIGKNLIYNVLSLMFKQKRVRKSDGRYYLLGNTPAPASMPKAASAPATAPKKRRISEEGMRRIIAASKKYQAAKRAAKAKGR